MTGAARRGHLELYLEPFKHTVAVMQTTEALTRVAPSAPRTWPPTGSSTPRCGSPRASPRWRAQPGRGGRGRASRVSGWAAPAPASRHVPLLTAMRTTARSLKIAELAVRYRDLGVVGFDIAGREAGCRRACTWTRSSTCSGRTSTSRSTRARRSACRRSGRPCSSAGRSGSGMGSGWSMTSRADPDGTACPRPARLLRPGPPDRAGDVPDLQRPDRRGRLHRRHPIGLLRDLASASPSTPITG